MPPSTRDLLASVLGEAPQAEPVTTAPKPAPRPSVPGPWRVTARVTGGLVQISNNLESRVVPKQQIEVYLRGHGPAVAPAC